MILTDSTAGFSPVSALTRSEVLDHAKYPRNRGVLPGAAVVREEVNPLCGDVVTMYATFAASGDQTHPAVQAASFDGHGCLLTVAAASMLTERVAGLPCTDILRMGREDMEALLGGEVSPSRVKCVLLPLIALKKGIQHGLSLYV